MSTKSRKKIKGAIKTILTSILLCLSIVVIFTGVKFLKEKIVFSSDEESNNTIAIKYPDPSIRYHYSKLDKLQKAFYDDFLETLRSGNNIESRTEFRDETSDVSIAFFSLFYDYPELYWLTSNQDDSLEDISREMEYGVITWEVTEEEKNCYEATKNLVLSKASEYGDDFDRIKYVYDWLVESVSYDYAGLKSTKNKSWIFFTKEEHQIYSAYGALVNRRAVCLGIALAFEDLLHDLGYKCGCITGTVGESWHAWNVVEINNRNYYFDVTWNLKDSKYARIDYSYFGITDFEIGRTRTQKTITRDDTLVPINEKNTSYSHMDFYYRKGYVVSEYSLENIYKQIDAQTGNDVVYLKFESEELYKMMLNDYDDIITYVRTSPEDKKSWIGVYNNDIYTCMFYAV